jgi:glycogen debranching enzyme
LFSAEQRSSVLNELASADFQTDWGTRGKAASDPTYDPNLYSSGSVWALATGTVARAFWAEHRPATAFPIWRALVPWSTLDSLGHMHELMGGRLLSRGSGIGPGANVVVGIVPDDGSSRLAGLARG